MTFYVDLLCEAAPIERGELSVELLIAAVADGYRVEPASFEVVSAMPDLFGGIDKHPEDGEAEARAVFGDLCTLDVGGWGLGAKDGVEHEESFRRYCQHIAQARPGTLVGCWEWLTGPEGTPSTPRFKRIIFDSIDALLSHEGEHNQVLLVRV